MPHHASVVKSHVIYEFRTHEKQKRTLKARIALHGNHECEKDNIRKDSAAAQLNIMRLVLCISAILNFQLATADIKGAYLQSEHVR